MKLSKYFKFVKLDNNIIAIFNTLLMEVIYVTEDEYEKIINFQVNEEDRVILQNAGIYVNTYTTDLRALQKIKDRYNNVCGNISIMYLILSSACNLACKYCFIENCRSNNKKEFNMSIETITSAITKYANYLNESNLEEGTIIFYGGEPLVNWEGLVYAIKLANKLSSKIKFTMVTNATLLDEKKIEFLSKNNVEIGISIDGPKQLNDKNRIYRAKEDSVYDEIMKKIPLLKAKQVKFGLSITVTKDFLNIQDDVLKWLKDLNVNSVFYNLYHFSNYSNEWENYYKEASEFLLKSFDVLSKQNIYDGRLNRKLDSIVSNQFKFADCAAIGGNQLTIKPNGDVCVCHAYFKTDKYIIGNINKDNIIDMISSTEFNFWKKRNTLNNRKCLNCEALFCCGGGCALQAESLFDDRNKIDKPFCIHTKTSLKWVLQKCYDKTIKENKKEVNL